jgi:hypothetical protein
MTGAANALTLEERATVLATIGVHSQVCTTPQ